jgi:hypothetical protein
LKASQRGKKAGKVVPSRSSMLSILLLYQGNMQRICSNQHKEGIAENHGTDSAINDIYLERKICSCIL